MQDLQELTKPSRRTSTRSRSRRSSISRSSSKTQALRLEAEKARLALAFAEEENQRKVEAEIKILELERKQRELVRRREVEEEQLKDTIRLESLKTEADSKLAEARKMAAIMELEAKIAEDMDSELSDNETTSMDLTANSHALPSSSVTFDPPLTATTPVLSSPSRVNGSPGVSASSTVTSLEPPVMSSFSPQTSPQAAPSLKPSSSTPALARMTLPSAHHPEISASLSATTGGLQLPVNSLSPLASPYSPPPVKTSSSVPACTKATVTSVHAPGTSILPSATERNPNPLVVNSLPPWTLPYPAPSVNPSSNIPPVSPARDEVLTMVASAMKDISMTQQRLAYNQTLPPIQFQRFSGAPTEFPLFKQRFNRIVMSREDMDDDNKMTRLLQFLDGDAKQAVSGLETVTGGVHQALQILEQRYGRPCMIVSSVVTSLARGPPIHSGDKVALRRFADCATGALATLTSINCLTQINQANIVSMTGRLPKPLQDKFAALAYDLETKGQHFPTLTNFVDFVNKHTSIANHPVSCKPQHFSYNNPPRNKRELPNGRSDLPKFTMSISNQDKLSVQSSKPPQKNAKGKSNNCRCCGQAHPLYRCEEFKRKTPRERKSSSLRKNCALTVLRTLNTQRTPVLVPSDAELKDVAPSTTPFFTQHSFTSVHPKRAALSTQPQRSTPQLPPPPVALPGPRIQVPSSCNSYHCV